jgi:hypothetical protein
VGLSARRLQFRDGHAHGLLVDVEDRDFRAFLGEAPGDGFADAVGRAGQGDWQEIEQALMGADFSILDRQAR